MDSRIAQVTVATILYILASATSFCMFPEGNFLIILKTYHLKRMHNSRDLQSGNDQAANLDSAYLCSCFRFLRLHDANVHQSDVRHAFSIWRRFRRILRFGQSHFVRYFDCWIHVSSFQSFKKINLTQLRAVYNPSGSNLYQLGDLPRRDLLHFTNGSYDAKQSVYLINSSWNCNFVHSNFFLINE